MGKGLIAPISGVCACLDLANIWKLTVTLRGKLPP